MALIVTARSATVLMGASLADCTRREDVDEKRTVVAHEHRRLLLEPDGPLRPGKWPLDTDLARSVLRDHYGGPLEQHGQVVQLFERSLPLRQQQNRCGRLAVEVTQDDDVEVLGANLGECALPVAGKEPGIARTMVRDDTQSTVIKCTQHSGMHWLVRMNEHSHVSPVDSRPLMFSWRLRAS
ncbi:hypothetical protein C5B85_16815 [Pseudoclavibacter sp. AY1F1]|nr:hypothetical protein C5B85_16815 [Pseudoclavibacter sp. AY1F1]